MGPLANMSPLDVMWVSFYSIGLLLVSMGLVSFARNKIKNTLLSFVVKLIAYIMFGIGSFLMVLIVATWPK